MNDLVHVENRHTVGSVIAASLRNYSAIWLFVIFVGLFSVTAPETFPTMLTLKLILTNQVTVGLLALALLAPLCAGAFDLSVGAMLAVSMAVTATLCQNGWNPAQAGLTALVLCALFGAFNGFLIVKLHIDSFIATLGTGQLLLAIVLRTTSNEQVVPPLPDWFISLSNGALLWINNDVLILFAVATILWFYLEHTPAGRGTFATGGNREAARLAGVPTGGLTVASLIISSVLAALAGILLLSKSGLYTQEFGPGFLFPAFAAVFFGATQFKGRPNVLGTLVAMYVLATAVAGLQLTFFGNQYWIDPLFNGTALLIAVALASRNRVGRTYRKLRKGGKSDGQANDGDGDPAAGVAVPAARERGM